MSVNLGKFLGASNNGEDNVYNLATVLERGDLKRCVLRTKREYTHVYILSFEFCKYLDTKSTHTHTHTHLQETNDMRFYWRSNVAQLKHPAPLYTAA